MFLESLEWRIRMKRILCLAFALLCLVIMFTGCSKPKTMEITLTPENFKEYFIINSEVVSYDAKLVKSLMGVEFYEGQGTAKVYTTKKRECIPNDVSVTVQVVMEYTGLASEYHENPKKMIYLQMPLDGNAYQTFSLDSRDYKEYVFNDRPPILPIKVVDVSGTVTIDAE